MNSSMDGMEQEASASGDNPIIIKQKAFDENEESIETWLDLLESKLDAAEIRNETKKIQWCKATV